MEIITELITASPIAGALLFSMWMMLKADEKKTKAAAEVDERKSKTWLESLRRAEDKNTEMMERMLDVLEHNTAAFTKVESIVRNCTGLTTNKKP